MNRLPTITALRRLAAVGGNFTRMMSTSGTGTKNIDYSSSGAASEDKDESSNKSSSPCLKQTVFYLEEFIAPRSDHEISALFFHWRDHHHKIYSEAEEMRRFENFKSRVRFIEEMNARMPDDSRLLLDCTADWSPKESLPVRFYRIGFGFGLRWR